MNAEITSNVNNGISGTSTRPKRARRATRKFTFAPPPRKRRTLESRFNSSNTSSSSESTEIEVETSDEDSVIVVSDDQANLKHKKALAKLERQLAAEKQKLQRMRAECGEAKDALRIARQELKQARAEQKTMKTRQTNLESKLASKDALVTDLTRQIIATKQSAANISTTSSSLDMDKSLESLRQLVKISADLNPRANSSMKDLVPIIEAVSRPTQVAVKPSSDDTSISFATLQQLSKLGILK